LAGFLLFLLVLPVLAQKRVRPGSAAHDAASNKVKAKGDDRPDTALTPVATVVDPRSAVQTRVQQNNMTKLVRLIANDTNKPNGKVTYHTAALL
jgi:hypothetical protein